MGRTLSELGAAARGRAQDGRARAAQDDGLGVREDRGDVEAARALRAREGRRGQGPGRARGRGGGEERVEVGRRARGRTLTSMKYELGDLRGGKSVSCRALRRRAGEEEDALHKALELVGLGGLLSGRVEEVNSERLRAATRRVSMLAGVHGGRWWSRRWRRSGSTSPAGEDDADKPAPAARLPARRCTQYLPLSAPARAPHKRRRRPAPAAVQLATSRDRPLLAPPPPRPLHAPRGSQIDGETDHDDWRV